MSNRRRFCGAFGLLMIFMSYQMSILLFTHMHFVNGEAIVHSHPYKSKHDHTPEQIVLLTQLSHYVSLEVDTIAKIDVPHIWITPSEVLGDVPFVACPFLENIALRAPPALV